MTIAEKAFCWRKYKHMDIDFYFHRKSNLKKNLIARLKYDDNNNTVPWQWDTTISNTMRKLQSDVGLHALEGSKSGGGALSVIPNLRHVPETSSPTSGYLDGKN